LLWTRDALHWVVCKCGKTNAVQRFTIELLLT